MYDDDRQRDIERFLLEERLRAIQEFERMLARRGAVPDAGRIFSRRLKLPLQWIGGMILGLGVSFAAMFITFFVANKLIHITF